jgi:hypothetical protein
MARATLGQQEAFRSLVQQKAPRGRAPAAPAGPTLQFRWRIRRFPDGCAYNPLRRAHESLLVFSTNRPAAEASQAPPSPRRAARRNAR